MPSTSHKRPEVSWFEHEAELRNHRLGSSEAMYRRMENQIKLWALAQWAREHYIYVWLTWTGLISIFGSGLHFEGEKRNRLTRSIALAGKSTPELYKWLIEKGRMPKHSCTAKSNKQSFPEAWTISNLFSWVPLDISEATYCPQIVYFPKNLEINVFRTLLDVHISLPITVESNSTSWLEIQNISKMALRKHYPVDLWSLVSPESLR